jgi:hypothetical protein
MTTTEKNEFLARWMGWEERHLDKYTKYYKHDGISHLDWELSFTSDWNWLQLAFQKARPTLTGSSEFAIAKSFVRNDIESAVNTLIQAIKENEH